MYNSEYTVNNTNEFIEMKTIAEGQSLANLILRDRIYVDKTKYIFSLLRSHERVFISRPRRFGKSLTLDTIGTLFEYGVEPYFKDTWIYDKWSENTYPVLRLNFLEFSKTDIDEFKRVFNEKLSVFAKENNIEDYAEDKEPSVSLQRLFAPLVKNRRHIVILIDEYDTQLTSNINNVELYGKYQNILREIYGVFKSAPLRFLGITGVTRIKDVALFSNGSDIIDISNHTAYSQMIGFTRDEIREYYIDYLKLAASCENGVSESEVTDSQIEEILDKLDYHYNGYCFDKYGEKKVFSTWSVNNFFKELVSTKKCTYGDYWYDNGGVPSILSNYLETHNLSSVEVLASNEIITVDLNDFLNPQSLIGINEHVLMCQTGYLTLRSSLVDTDGWVDLGIPNNEVRKALLLRLRMMCFEKRVRITGDEARILNEGDVSSIISLFNTVLNSVAYDHFCIVNEAAVRTVIYLGLLRNQVNIQCEVQSSKGRADLVIETSDRRIVLEFKYAQNENEAKAKLDEAVAQIKARDYGNILPLKKETLKIAAVFNADQNVRAICEYQKV